MMQHEDPQRADTRGSRAGGGGGWAAFLAMTFAVVGLVGLFATYAVPVPLMRALAHDAVLDEALATATAADPAAALTAMRPRLGEEAALVIDGGGPLAERVHRARLAMHARLTAEATALAARMRMLVLVVTALGGFFGIAVLRFGRV